MHIPLVYTMDKLSTDVDKVHSMRKIDNILKSYIYMSRDINE